MFGTEGSPYLLIQAINIFHSHSAQCGFHRKYTTFRRKRKTFLTRLHQNGKSSSIVSSSAVSSSTSTPKVPMQNHVPVFL